MRGALRAGIGAQALGQVAAAVAATLAILATAARAEVPRELPPQQQNRAGVQQPAVPAPTRVHKPSDATARIDRLAAMAGVRSWGYQLSELDLEAALNSPFDLLVVDATTGLRGNAGFTAEQVAHLKRKPDGSRRLVVSYLSIGEAEDYRTGYFDKEYMSEEPPDWLLKENPRWKGNRIIRFCEEGWQRTILGDDNGRSLYNDIDPSPLYRLLELGFDGVYLDRVDVYAEVRAQCPSAADKAVAFVKRLAAHARKRDPRFLVILQNAEELLRQKPLVDAIDAVAKEDLVHTPDDSGRLNSEAEFRDIAANLDLAKAAGRAVLVVDYPKGRSAAELARQRILAKGFIPYVAPRKLDALRLPGVDY